MTRPPDPARPYEVAAPLRGTETIKARCGDVRPGSGDWLQLVDVDPVDLGADADGGALVVNLHPSMLAGPIIVRRTVPRERTPDPTVEDLTEPFTRQTAIYQDYRDTIPRADPEAEPLPDPLSDEALATAAAGIVAAGRAGRLEPVPLSPSETTYDLAAFKETAVRDASDLRGVLRGATLDPIQAGRADSPLADGGVA